MKKINILVLLFGVFIVSQPKCGFALTLSDIQTEIRRNIRDTATDSSLQKYTDAVLLNLINEAQREVINITWAIHNSTSLTLSASTTFYDLPTDLIAPIRVIFTRNGRTYELDETTIKVLDDDNANWQNSSKGQPIEYYIRLSTQAADPLEIAYIPIPPNTSTGTIFMDYFMQSTDLSAGTDVPFEGFRHLYPYHFTLVYHATERIKAMEGKTQEATFWAQKFIRAMQIMDDRLGRRPNYTPGMRGAGR